MLCTFVAHLLLSVAPNQKLGWVTTAYSRAISDSSAFEYTVFPSTSPSVTESAAVYALVARADAHEVETYLRSEPDGAYSGSLWLNIALLHQRRGYLSKSKTEFAKAVSLLDSVKQGDGKEEADLAIASLGQLQALSGDEAGLSELSNRYSNRPFSGSASEKWNDDRDSLRRLRSGHEGTSNCASLAILAFAQASRVTIGSEAGLRMSNRSSLGQILLATRRIGIVSKPVQWRAGEPFPCPAIIHWKIGHFATVIERTPDGVRLRDPSMPEMSEVSFDVLQKEVSSEVLTSDLSSKYAPASWSRLRRLIGAGPTSQTTPGDTGDKGSTTGCTGSNGGGSAPSKPMASYDMHALLCGLKIFDTPVGYQPPAGPDVFCKLTYSQREAGKLPPKTTNFGNDWRFSFLAYVEDDFSTGTTPIYIYLRNGGSEHLAPGTAEKQSLAITTRTTTPDGYVRKLPDGSKETYAQIYSIPASNKRYYFLSSVSDAWGNTVTLTYDTSTGGVRLTKIADAFGKPTTIAYRSDDPYKVSSIKDPFGRTAILSYHTTNSDGLLRLIAIKDLLGLVSSFTYSTSTSSDFITVLTTPYGSTKFATSDETVALQTTYGSKTLTATDPLGQMEMLEQYGDAIPDGVPSSDVEAPVGYVNNWLDTRNSFYWNKIACRAYVTSKGRDHGRAKIYHWLHDGVAGGPATGILESYKEPLENRVWLSYKNQVPPDLHVAPDNMIGSMPQQIVRMLGSGNAQVTNHIPNAQGKMTGFQDPLGRSMTMQYDSTGLDLQSVVYDVAGVSPIATLSQYLHHKPQVYVDQSGGKFTLVYNATSGQLSSITNPRNDRFSLTYDSNHRLYQILGPTNQVLKAYTYDAYGGVASITDNLGQKILTKRDVGGRLLTATFPDGTTETYTYDRLDVGTFTDRQARTTLYQYNPLRQLMLVRDPENRLTRYGWCLCGHLGSVLDANGHSTTWKHDIEGRITQKIYDDQSNESYRYWADTGALRSATDPLLQVKSFTYNDDGTLRLMAYANPLAATHSVTLRYDPNYPRLASVTDGTGTTTYSYFPYDGTPGAGRVKLAKGPGATESVNYQYDPLNRPSSVSLPEGAETFQYDSLGRLQQEDNPLGSFVYGFLGNSDNLASVTGGPVSASYSYTTAPNDILLSKITNDAAGSTISSFGYTHYKEGAIQTWTSAFKVGSATGNFKFGYDKDEWLTSAEVDNSSGTKLTGETFGYDGMGNRLTSTAGSDATTYSAIDNLNRTGAQATASLKQAYQYSYDSNGSETGITFTDGNTPANNFKATLTWDAEHRLVGYATATHISAFTYNYLNHCTQIVEKDGSGHILSTRHFLWDGDHIVRETNDSESKLFYSQGVDHVGGQKLYYSKDHLGSIREIVDSTAKVVDRYQYDAYGRMQIVLGAATDFGYAGYMMHSPSGLWLTTYRAYDPRLGKWISRDPAGENGGLNLFGYANQEPIVLRDMLGLAPSGNGGDGGGFGRHPGSKWDRPDYGPPNSYWPNPGRPGEGRYYGPDGRPSYDLDGPHASHPPDSVQGGPHVHGYPNGKRDKNPWPFSPWPRPGTCDEGSEEGEASNDSSNQEFSAFPGNNAAGYGWGLFGAYAIGEFFAEGGWEFFAEGGWVAVFAL